ncbi:MFS transporter [Curtobacterium sp. NPDC089689]|uniref:MFS transporter n=1 Tax=Curtobacterium sp. NPDC089689 TaxID=3363968 RepID=UPI0037F565B3
MKRSFSLRRAAFLGSGLALIAVTYGLVRLAFGLFLPDVQRDLDLDATAAGWVSAAASACYCVGALAGFVLARSHARALVVAATVTAAAGALGMAASSGAVVFSVAAMVGSASAGLASPALVRLVEERVSRPGRTRAQAFVNAGTGPGLVVAGVLALLLLPDWRTAWAVSGVAAVLVGAVVLVAAGRRDEHDGGRGPSTPGRRWSRAHARLLVVALLYGAGTASVWTFGRSTLVDAGASTVTSVLLWLTVGVGGAAVTVTSRRTAGLRARTMWLVTALVTAAAVAVEGVVPASGAVSLAAGVVFGWGYTAATGALIAWTTEIAPEHAAAGTSVLFVVLVLGQAVGAAGLGAVLDAAGPAVAFLLAAAVTAIGAVGSVRSRRSQERAELDLPVAGA